MAMQSFVAYALFLFSGAAGLLYEVLWARQFAHVLGGSYPAVVAVVAAFLGGLAAGAALGGRWAPRLRRPLRAYAILEAAIGAYGLLFPLLLAGCAPLLGWCYRTFEDLPAVWTLARFLVAAALLLPPTVAMGATLPVLVRFVVAGGKRVLGGTGLLYGLNTVGASGGALATGLWLLPALGLRGTLLVGVGVNLAVAALAFLADFRLGRDLEPEAGTPAPAAPEPAPEPAPSLAPESRRALLLLAVGSGLAAMLYQLAWTKALILAFGSSVQAFTLVVATFILGLGLGGLLAPLVKAAGPRLLLALAGIEAAVGVAAALGIHRVAYLPLAVIRQFPALYGDYDALLVWQAGQALLVVFLPTLGMGAAFPILVAALAGDAGQASRSVGRVYGWNTAGTIAGSLGGGLLVIPSVGIRGAILVGAVLQLGLAALLAASVLPRRRGTAVAGGVLLATALLVQTAPLLPPHLLNCGPYLYGGTYYAAARKGEKDLDRAVRDLDWDTPFFREGRTATVGIVCRPDGGACLRINGKTDGGTGDLSTQVLLGQLPAMARPGARNGLVIGLATGISAAALASHGIERLDVVDISPEVVEASRFFDGLNGGVTRLPGVRVIVEDGRTHVEHSRESYDVIVTEPTNPWIAGVSNLFTVEYFRACRERLAGGGVLCVWLQAYRVSREDFAMVVRTLRSVFPNLTVWEVEPYVDFALVASKDDAADLVERIASREFPGGAAAASLALGGITGREALLATLALDRGGAEAFAGEGPLHTDDRIQLEFRTPRGAFEDAGYPILNFQAMDRFLDPSPVLAFAGRDDGRLRAALESRRMAREGTGFFRLADDPIFRGRFQQWLLRDPVRIRALAVGLPPGPRAKVLAAGTDVAKPGTDEGLLTHLMWARAVELLEGALRLNDGNRWPRERLADGLQSRALDSLRTGDLVSAEKDYLRAAQLHPGSPYLARGLADLHVRAAGGDPASPHLPEALRFLDEAIRLSPRFEYALVEKGATLATMNRDEEADAVFRSVLEMRPDSVIALADYAQLQIYRGRTAEARALVERGLAFEPASRALLHLQGQLDRGVPAGK